MTSRIRDHEAEFEDLPTRKYAYDFDYILRDYMLRAFEPLLPAGRALEMGCYKGEFTKRLARYYDDLTVIEAAPRLIGEAKRKVADTVRFIHSTFEELETEEHFDAIFLIHTLEHLDEPVLVLKKVKSWLTEQGRLFLVVPNANAPSRQLAVKMGLISHKAAVTEGEFAHGHRRTYGFDTLEHDARGAGLEVLHRGGVFFKPFANFQFDPLIKSGLISQQYLDACYELGMEYPDLCASIYLLCGPGGSK